MGFLNRGPKVIDNSTGEVGTAEKQPGQGGDVKNRCNHRWGKEPKFPQPNGHYKHWCGLIPNHKGSHICMAQWECGETDG